ncbi:carbohydrate kinase family protein [Trueperella pyogenes]|uniref:carbohydrate kinase family protein n=1 Tax=Trueperella pyogenes TaxID=1661 RepID=UPI00324EC750
MVHVLAAGPLFLDVIQYGLAHAPRPGEEQWVADGQIMAGGVANQAVACARLGLDVEVLTNVGADRAGRWVAELLADEDVRIGGTRGGSQSVTVAQVFEGDRAFTTYGDAAYPTPPANMPAPDFLIASVDYLPRASEAVRRWRAAGCVVVADTAWDPTGRWNRADLAALAEADIAVPNDAEALAYTRTHCVHDAATQFLQHVPVVAITRGAHGVLLAEHGPTGGRPRLTELPAVDVRAKDTTGAGDSFTAGFVRGLAHGASLAEAAALGQVTAAWTVQHLGGSAAAPTSAELVAWAKSGRLAWAGSGSFAAPNLADVVTRLLPAG